jgi:NAD-dependent dihydropyrimidine dehydrogenase PreA subunit
MAVLVTDRCQGCGACLLTCPEHAIRPHGSPLTVLGDRCTSCLECVDICPVDAIEEEREGERDQ